MKKTKIQIPKHEDETTEFKESPANLEKEIVAFANNKGGKIYIGIDDQGKVKATSFSNKMRSQIIQSINNCQPLPVFRIEDHENLIVLHIIEGTKKPYKAPNGFYYRLGATSQKLNRDEIVNFFITENQISFDKQIIASVEKIDELEYIDAEEIIKYKERASYLNKLTNREMLLNLNLVEFKNSLYHITNAAVLLFSNKPQSYFPQSRILIWLMSATSEILDHKAITGNLFQQLEQAMIYLKSNLRTSYLIEGLQRQEVLEIPELVLRELIVNQLIHRNYFENGADIEIKIYPDRIDFANPAVLPKGKFPEEMVGVSYRRNPLLAEAFQRVGLVERAGTGLIRIKNNLNKAGSHKRFFLSQEAMYFIATIKRELEQIENISNNKLEDSILSILNISPKGTQELSTILSTSVRTVRNNLNKLVEKGQVKSIRDGRRIVYVVEDKK